jgi:hypothetical protein
MRPEGSTVPLNEKVTSYFVTLLKNDLVGYGRILRLTTDSGHRVFIGFEVDPRLDWLEITESYTSVFLQSDEFDQTYHLLQTESPVYFSAFKVIGMSAYNLSTDQVLPGEGLGDEEALVTVAAQMRQQSPESEQ